jgi:hypothetical protein
LASWGPGRSAKRRWRSPSPIDKGGLYLDLEAREDRDKLSDPALFLRDYEDRLVILDEIHRVPVTVTFNAMRSSPVHRLEAHEESDGGG